MKKAPRPARSKGEAQRRKVSGIITRLAAEFAPVETLDFSDVPDAAVRKCRSARERREAFARIAAEFAPKSGEKPGRGGAVAFLLQQRRSK